ETHLLNTISWRFRAISPGPGSPGRQAAAAADQSQLPECLLALGRGESRNLCRSGPATREAPFCRRLRDLPRALDRLRGRRNRRAKCQDVRREALDLAMGTHTQG